MSCRYAFAHEVCILYPTSGYSRAGYVHGLGGYNFAQSDATAFLVFSSMSVDFAPVLNSITYTRIVSVSTLFQSDEDGTLADPGDGSSSMVR